MVNTGPSFSDFVFKGKGTRRKLIGSRDSIRDFFPIFALSFSFLMIVLSLFNLQIVKGKYYKNLSDENRTKIKIVPAERGIIFDRENIALVRNVPSYWLSENGKIKFIEKSEALKLMAEGKEVQTGTQREYVFGESMAHVLGYIGQITSEQILLPKYKEYHLNDFVGVMGVEREYESFLKGKDGKELYEVNAKREVIRFLGSQDPIPGKDIKTTLDANLQAEVFNAMKDVKKGAVIVSDANSGDILAMVSKPSFDPNIFTHDESYKSSYVYNSVTDVLNDSENQPLLNRAVSGMYPPGSTFKLISAVAALESNKINKNTKIEDTGVIKVGSFSFGNWFFLSYGRTEGLLDVISALKRSNDIFFYKAAEWTGVHDINRTAVKFGLGEMLGIDLVGEEKGVLPDEAWKKKNIGEAWYLGDTYHFGIGQGYLLTTPLQVNFFTSVFANGGALYRPHLLAEKKQVISKDFIKREYISLVREGMRQSCDEGGVAWPLFNFKVKNETLRKGSGQELKTDERDFVEDVASDGAKMTRVSIGCKTGTAETYGDKNPHAWITLFAPFYKPEIVVTVLVEYGGEGSNVAAPIAKKILEAYFEKK